MRNEDMPAPAPVDTTLAVLYFTPNPPSSPPASKASFFGPAMTNNAGKGDISPYDAQVYGSVRPPAPTRTISFAIDFYKEPNENDPKAVQYAHFNNVSLEMTPESTSLLARLSNNPAGLAAPVQPKRGRGWHVVEVQSGEVVDIIINNNDNGEHPIHVHGHWFWVMGHGLADDGNYKGQQLKPTVARDTVTVKANSYLVLRYIANNPGAWIMHCHIDWHFAAGLGLIFKEGYGAPIGKVGPVVQEMGVLAP